jgi:hypothetical protein
VVRKIYLYLASSMSILGLSLQGACALAELSVPTAVSPKHIVTAEVVSTAARHEAPGAAEQDVATLTTIPVTPPAIAPVTPATIPQEQAIATTSSQMVATEEMSATANPDSLAAAEPAVVTWKTNSSFPLKRSPKLSQMLLLKRRHLRQMPQWSKSRL